MAKLPREKNKIVRVPPQKKRKGKRETSRGQVRDKVLLRVAYAGHEWHDENYDEPFHGTDQDAVFILRRSGRNGRTSNVL